jgi:hypothetical protein
MKKKKDLLIIMFTGFMYRKKVMKFLACKIYVIKKYSNTFGQ